MQPRTPAAKMYSGDGSVNRVSNGVIVGEVTKQPEMGTGTAKIEATLGKLMDSAVVSKL